MSETKPEKPKTFQCRHIFTDGQRCGSPSLRKELFCYYHHTTRTPIDPQALEARRARTAEFQLPSLEDRSAIQLAVGEILSRIADRTLDPKRAGLLLYGLQIASRLLPKEPKDQVRKPDPVEDITLHPDLGAIAPEVEIIDPYADDEDEEEEDYVWDRERLPKLQAAATTPGAPGTGQLHVPHLGLFPPEGPHQLNRGKHSQSGETLKAGRARVHACRKACLCKTGIGLLRCRPKIRRASKPETRRSRRTSPDLTPTIRILYPKTGGGVINQSATAKHWPETAPATQNASPEPVGKRPFPYPAGS